ncbi:MAG: sulfatase-like hydrolase/transferase, partial [Verrucomicrobiota bacterium]
FDRAMAFVERHRNDRFFCFVPTPVTHSPHHGPKDLVQQLKADGVEGNVELFAQVMNLDMNIGRMMDKLDALDLSRDTILIYASDQGMNDRGAPHGGNRRGLAYDPAHHVPFFIRVPGTQPAVTTQLGGMIDVFPTLLDLCGLPIPPSSDGMSLKPVLNGKALDRTLIVQCPRGRVASKWKNASVKQGPWRLTNGEKLYDIEDDPRQKTDIAAQHPVVVKQLREAYEVFWADLPDQNETLSRHVLGAEACPEVTLNGMDWYRGASPWNRGAFRGKANGAWAVEVERDGRYTIECRHYPREAKKPAEADHARLKIGDQEWEQKVDETDEAVRFEVALKAGEYDLETWLSKGKRTRGALFVYVEGPKP